MKTVLGIDSATLTASVAVVRGERCASFELLAAGQSNVNTHSQELIELVDQALSAASLGLGDVDGIAVGAGPGSFTGLRIGMATAKGLAFAAQKPLWAVSSLAALALALDEPDGEHEDAGEDARRQGTLAVPVLDARRGEIFVGFYRLAGGATAVAAEQVMAPDALGKALAAVLERTGCERAVLVGDGVEVYADAIGGSLDGAIIAGRRLSEVTRTARGAASTPPAAAVARLTLDGEHDEILISGAPTYIRLSEAEIKYPEGNPGGTFARR
jgi:tRNA threonylcarbamoyladenosine biosynthesis protein TsaB